MSRSTVYYTFETAESAQAAVASVNAAQGIPIHYLNVPLFHVTKNYCDVRELDGEFLVIKDGVTSAASQGWIEKTVIDLDPEDE